jgi:regulator of protease activity HflC (stomatin/prohibitin superfamily)
MRIKISALISFCWFVAIVLGGLFLVFTNYYVQQNEYTVVMNKWTMQFKDTVYSQGLYFLGPGVEMIPFQRTLQELDLGRTDCLTRDEVLVDLKVALQYQYDQKQLIPFILQTFGSEKKYVEFLTGTARSIILNTCLEFTALEYYEIRSVIDTEMFSNLIKNINDKHYGCSIEYFQLVDIQYPPDYITILHEKQNVKQDLITAENHRSTEEIGARTTQLEARRTASINLINAHNIYNMTLYDAQTQKEAIVSLWKSRAVAFNNIISDLNLTYPRFIEYLKSNVVRTSQLITSV